MLGKTRVGRRSEFLIGDESSTYDEAFFGEAVASGNVERQGKLGGGDRGMIPAAVAVVAAGTALTLAVGGSFGDDENGTSGGRSESGAGFTDAGHPIARPPRSLPDTEQRRPATITARKQRGAADRRANVEPRSPRPRSAPAAPTRDPLSERHSPAANPVPQPAGDRRFPVAPSAGATDEFGFER